MATVVTKTIKPSGGGDYTTLAAAYTAQARDLVAADEQEDWICYAGNAGAISLGALLVTDATRFLRIKSSDDGKHGGVWDDAKAKISSQGTCVEITSNNSAFVRIERMLIETSGQNSVAVYSIVSTASGYAGATRLINCLVRGTYAGGGNIGASGPIMCINTIAYGFRKANGRCFSLTGYARAYGCVGIGAQYAFYGNTSNFIAKNCIAQGCTDGFYVIAGFTGSNNVSDVAVDAPGTDAITGTVQFKDAANYDYHLAATDTVARGAGVNLTASGITTDIDGETRPATGGWDIGADQYTSPPSTGPWGTPKFGISYPFGAQKFGVTPWM